MPPPGREAPWGSDEDAHAAGPLPARAGSTTPRWSPSPGPRDHPPGRGTLPGDLHPGAERGPPPPGRGARTGPRGVLAARVQDRVLEIKGLTVKPAWPRAMRPRSWRSRSPTARLLRCGGGSVRFVDRTSAMDELGAPQCGQADARSVRAIRERSGARRLGSVVVPSGHELPAGEDARSSVAA